MKTQMNGSAWFESLIQQGKSGEKRTSDNDFPH